IKPDHHSVLCYVCCPAGQNKPSQNLDPNNVRVYTRQIRLWFHVHTVVWMQVSEQENARQINNI
ncbi:MAG: hypothetical protein V3R41_02330, partial [Gammaproteobacteria bacterium]